MEVKKLEHYLSRYADYLKKDRNYPELYKWEALGLFQKNWDIDHPDFGAMYDASLQSTKSKRLWKQEAWLPKEIMLEFIQQDPEFVRKMFKNLFDENKTHVVRISQFKFCCDELLSDYKRKHKTSIENSHYHDDNRMVLMYLCFQYPEQYTLFDYVPFLETVKRMGVGDLPGPFDLERFFKLSKILYVFLKKKEALLHPLQEKRLDRSISYTAMNQLMTHDFYEACGSGYLD